MFTKYNKYIITGIQRVGVVQKKIAESDARR